LSSRPPDTRRGLLYGAAAYGLWGLFPLYWPLLEPAGAVEILAHRVLWSAITISLVVTLLRRWPHVLAVWRRPRSRLLLVSAAVVISVNWSIYIYGVNSGRVVETSLGYFINPLVTVLMGVVVLSERLRPLQWAALALATGAVVVLAFDYGHLPWIALVLAFSFGTYGLLKKQAGVDPLESLTIETVVLAPVALAYLAWLGVQGDSNFVRHGAGHSALFLTTGIVTVIPLLFFGAAAIRLPLVTIGMLQYLAPVLQFLLGVFWYHESMPPARWIGFALVWIALVAFTVEAMQQRRRHLRLLGEATIPV
jgi:chloramphenicol-sensitive protein RarD